jgi:hypothetical protein
MDNVPLGALPGHSVALVAGSEADIPLHPVDRICGD